MEWPRDVIALHLNKPQAREQWIDNVFIVKSPETDGQTTRRISEPLDRSSRYKRYIPELRVAYLGLGTAE